MFYLHVANRSENLLRKLCSILAEERHVDIFATELFLIQSQGMERMVAQSVAEQFSCFCNFQFFLPLDFLSYIAGRLNLQINSESFQRQIMVWRIDEVLRDLAPEEFQPLRYYLSGERSGLKRFQLARRLANILDQYQVLRPDYLSAWEKGRRVTDHPGEMWQMSLWCQLLQTSGEQMHRGAVLGEVIKRLAIADDLSHLLPKRISVLGLHTMPPIFLEYLNQLAGHMDVHFFLLSPCRHYWGDMESRRAQLKRMSRQSYPGNMETAEHHPLLVALGQQGRDFQNMFLDSIETFEESDEYDNPLDSDEYASVSLLQRLQADLLEDRAIEGQASKIDINDDSIRVVSCHSRLRELQVLKDHLLFLLHSDSLLELCQIVVMAPDIQEYSGLIPAVFSDIQHSIADRSLRKRNPVIAAFLTFLDLFLGRFGWSEVFDLLRLPQVYPRFQLTLADLDTLQKWVNEAGIRWGLSGEQRSEEGLPSFPETSWRAGLERLLMGYAIDSEDLVDGILPYRDIEGRGAQRLGGLCGFIDMLEHAHRDFQQPRSLQQWLPLLLHYVQQVFGDSEDPALLELRSILVEPVAVIGEFHQSALDFAIIREWLNLSSKERRSSSGFLRGQLTFCSMLPMRSIPFPVVCLLGLNDGEFPKNDHHDTFDLLATDFRPGDRSPRADDRYQFLEAILAARSHLYLSYVGQSMRTGDPVPPSVVLSEFLELLETSYGVQELVVNHPLHSFSSKYFSSEGDQKIFSYNEYLCRTAKALQQGVVPKISWWQGRIPEEVTTVCLADLLRFADGPQKYFLSSVLGIRYDLDRALPEERESFELSGLDRHLVDQRLLQIGLAGGMRNGLETLKAEGRWLLGSPGKLVFSEKSRQVEAFLQRVEGLDMGGRQADMSLDVTVDSIRLVGNLGHLQARGPLLLRFGKLRGRDLFMGWMYHLLANHVRPGQVTAIVALDITIIFSSYSEGPNLSRLLSLFIEGSRRPLPLFLEPAYAYAQQEAKPAGRSTPLEKALSVLRTRMANGFERELTLLYGDAPAEEVLGAEFLDLCQEIVCPILRGADAL